MNKKILVAILALLCVTVAVIFIYPRPFASHSERKVLYWTDPMIPGDRSDHPGTSPKGMERIPVYGDETQAESVKTENSGAETYYTCPMHPSVRSDRPGACPVCGMALVRKSGGTELSHPEHQSVSTVAISPSRQVLANVTTTTATRMRLQKEIRAVGRIDYAEPMLRHITMRFPGRIEKLYVTYTGETVRKGAPVADVYSPEAISAQQEFLLALSSFEQGAGAGTENMMGTHSLVGQAREKLVRWGFTGEQIKELQTTKQVKDLVRIHAPISGTVLKKSADPQQYKGVGEELFDVADLSTVWMIADVYEYEMQWLKTGQSVEATSEAYPGRIFIGAIAFVSPTIDPSSRTVRVRAEFQNPRGELKIDMFLSATIDVKLPSAIVVPRSAVLSTGQRNVVWVEKGAGIYEPRSVTLGAGTEEYYQILDGIREGDVVVSSGGYLIDSESQLAMTTRGDHEHDR